MNKFEGMPQGDENNESSEAKEVSPQEKWNGQVEASKEKARELMSSAAELEGSFSNFPPAETVGIKMVGSTYELSAPNGVDAHDMERLQDLYNQLTEVLVPAEGGNVGKGSGHPLSFSIYNKAKYLTPRQLFESINTGLKAAEEFKG